MGWQARPRWRVTRGAQIALGPGKADLLEAIATKGSISRAAGSMRMSYRRAWLLVETMNQCFDRPLVATSRRRREGARLTDDGARVLQLYRRLERLTLAASGRTLRELSELLRSGH